MHGQQVELLLPARPSRNDDWRDNAACADEPHPDRWVDLPAVRVRGKNNPDYDARVTELAQTCGTCPVRDHCLYESLDMNVRGVFAGMDEFDRADLRDYLHLPTPALMPAPENDEDARLMEQQFAALRLARKGYTNIAIAAELGVSPMTVSRLTADEERPAERRTKHPHIADASAYEGGVEVSFTLVQHATEDDETLIEANDPFCDFAYDNPKPQTSSLTTV